MGVGKGGELREIKVSQRSEKFEKLLRRAFETLCEL
jgi:hypothetical protein